MTVPDVNESVRVPIAGAGQGGKKDIKISLYVLRGRARTIWPPVAPAVPPAAATGPRRPRDRPAPWRAPRRLCQTPRGRACKIGRASCRERAWGAGGTGAVQKEAV